MLARSLPFSSPSRVVEDAVDTVEFFFSMAKVNMTICLIGYLVIRLTVKGDKTTLPLASVLSCLQWSDFLGSIQS